MCNEVLALAAAMMVGSQSWTGAENNMPSYFSSNISSCVQSVSTWPGKRGANSGSSGGAECPSLADSTIAAA
eukprot:6075996-Prymnesium_polylepis.1